MLFYKIQIPNRGINTIKLALKNKDWSVFQLFTETETASPVYDSEDWKDNIIL